MIIKDLFNKVLIEPIKNGADTLNIVSGYATAAMAFHHLEYSKNLGKQIKINLIVGMCPYDGLSLSNHKAFQHLTKTDFPKYFECSYIFKPPPVHSKTYIWLQGDKLIAGFVGSANYTQNAFSNTQRELLVDCDPQQCFNYYDSLVSDSIYCTHNDIDNLIVVYRDTYYSRKAKEKMKIPGVKTGTSQQPDLQGLPSVKISFLDNYGNLPQRSGLNWGQRPEYRREPNQAYIRLPANIYKTDFFPPKAVHFTVLTDDDKVLICTRAQQNDKAIETPHNNSLIGEYFRNRLGLASGQAIKKDKLLNYGRTDVDFYKIDNETYFMDFSVSVH